MKGGYLELSVYLACLSFILNFYASFITFYGFLNHLVSFLLISCGFFAILWRYRIPKPNEKSSRNFFGEDWGAYLTKAKTQEPEGGYVMKVVGHRACGLDAPENSLSALQKIIKEGITAVEFDVLLTSDGVPIVFHDVNLRRMTDVNKFVCETTYEDIKKLDISIKHPFGKDFKGERIPTLNEFVSYCLSYNVRMFIDLKYTGYHIIPNIVQIITNLYAEHPKLYELGLVSSFNPVIIYKIRAKDPKIGCSLAWRPYYYSHEEYNSVEGPLLPQHSNLGVLMALRILNNFHQWALWKFGYYLLGLSAVLLHKEMITRDIIQYWKKRGIRVIAWSVNLPSEKQYFAKILQITYLTDTVINS